MGSISNTPRSARSKVVYNIATTPIILFTSDIWEGKAVKDCLELKPGFGKVQLARNFKELNPILLGHPDAVVVFDMFSSHYAGVYLAKYIQKNYPTVAMMSVSEYSHTAFALIARNFGVRGYMPRSGGIEMLREILNLLMQGNDELYLGTRNSEDSTTEDFLADLTLLRAAPLQVWILAVADRTVQESSDLMGVSIDAVNIDRRAIKGHFEADKLDTVLAIGKNLQRR